MARQPLSPSEARREREMLRELRRFHREHDCGDADAPTATQLAKKRLRVPAVDVDTNPFCMERQLADEYERMNLNKNPRFYAVALDKPSIVRENPRNYSSFANQVTDRIASSGVSPRARAEFSAKRPAPSYEPPVAQFSSPTVFSVDPSNLRRDLKAGGNTNTAVALPPAHEQYGVHLTKQTVTFGHRPGSGGRMYDRLTDSISGPGGVKGSALPSPSSSRSCDSVSSRRSSALSTPIKTGMSVMALAQLLAPPKASDRSASSSVGPTSLQFGSESDEDGNDDEDDGDDEQQDEDVRQRWRRRRARREQRRKQQELQELERKYENVVFNPKKERRPPQFLPPTDQSTAQLIDKYRKLAVGKLPGADDGE